VTSDFGFWCDICGKNDSAPHTPIDHPWLLKGHRLIPKPKVDEMVAAAIAHERARILAAIEALRVATYKRGEGDYLVGFRQSRNETVKAVIAAIEGETP
jgi:hypothetical protein